MIAAHPDDVDFSAAGTIAGWTDAGIEVVYCVVTDGDAGGHDDSMPRAEIAPLRRKEQTAAAACVGVSDLRFLGYPDGQVEATLGLRRDLARVIRQVRPDRVVCPSPERNYARIGVSHPDHRAVGSAALDAVYPDARNPYAFPELRAGEGLEPWPVREVWLPGGPVPNRYVDVTGTFGRSSRRCARTRARPGTWTSWRTFCASGWPPPRPRAACPRAGSRRPSRSSTRRDAKKSNFGRPHDLFAAALRDSAKFGKKCGAAPWR